MKIVSKYAYGFFVTPAMFVGHKDSVTCVGFNHDSSLVVTGDMAGLMKVWSVDSQQEVWSYEVDDLEVSSYYFFALLLLFRLLEHNQFVI